MRHDPGGRLPPALFSQILPGRHVVHSVRCGSGVHLSVGHYFARFEALWTVGDAAVHWNFPGWILLRVEKGRAGLGRNFTETGKLLVALAPAITDLEQLKNHPAVARLLGWNSEAVTGAKFDRDEMTIYIDRAFIREACIALKDDPACPFNFLSDV